MEISMWQTSTRESVIHSHLNYQPVQTETEKLHWIHLKAVQFRFFLSRNKEQAFDEHASGMSVKKKRTFMGQQQCIDKLFRLQQHKLHISYIIIPQSLDS